MHIPGPRILIVDDEPNVLLTVEAILQQEGYDTTAVASGEAALQAVREHHYDLVLTDLKMPRVDGLQVLQEVRKYSPDTVTVMMTGYASVDSALEAVQLGAYEYLLKPTEVVNLKAAVRRSLERKRLSEIDTLYRVSGTLTRTLDVAHICREVEEAVRGVLNLRNTCMVVVDRAHAFPCAEESLQAALRDAALQDRLAGGAIILKEDATPPLLAWAEEQKLQAFAVVPGIAGERLACVLMADNGEQPFEFHASALRFLQSMVSQSALALENASLIGELQKNNRELEAANSKLRELDKLKSQFLSVATHELRTPLSVILGYNAMLAENLADRLTAEENGTLHESVQACKRLIRLVNSMLDITQIESGKMQMNFDWTDLRQLVSGVVALFQPEARRLGVQLHTEVPARLRRVLVDGERIEQVLVNLVGNALKFTPPAGSVTVSLRQASEQDACEIAVTDTGVGIPADAMPVIFDEFTQIRNKVESRQRGGSGLGLAIARRIVEAHEGRLEVESMPGRGSTFRFRLPQKNGRAASPAFQVERAHGSTG